MILRLRTANQIDRALEFLRAERLRRVRVLWTIGVVTEQRTTEQRTFAARVPFDVIHTARRLSRESDMRVVITATQQQGLSIAAVDKRGNPAVVENIKWDTSDPSIATVQADPDGTAAFIKATGPVGNCQVNVTGDAQLGDGEVPISATLDLEVVAGQAASFTLNVTGAPTEQAGA